MNDHMFWLAQDIFMNAYAKADMKGDVPEMSCVAIKAAHEFCGIWDQTQAVLEGESQKAVEASTQAVTRLNSSKSTQKVAAMVKEEEPPGFKRRTAAKRKRKKAS